MVKGNTEISDGAAANTQVEMPAMSGVNLVKAEKVKRHRLSWKDHKRFTIALSLIGVVIIGLAVAIIVVNAIRSGTSSGCNGGDCSGSSGTGEGCDNKDLSSYDKEMYGDNPSPASRASILYTNIMNRLGERSDYNYEDALVDFDEAYEKGDDEFKVQLAYMYGYFIMVNTAELEESINKVQSIESLLNGSDDFAEYYTIIGNLYNMAGQDAMANYYWQMSRESAAESGETGLDKEYINSIVIKEENNE